ncbi:MAG TPA: alginate lyase family protein [Gemmatimonas sp.]|nr:alginate lyase family protein [Gemmatimonas sp.]
MLRKLVRMSPQEIGSRALRRLLDEVEPVFPGAGPSNLQDSELVPRTPWVIHPRASSAPDSGAIVTRAEAAMDGRISLLGLGTLDLGPDPDSHRDPTTGLRSPLVRWNRIPYLDAGIVGDHKAVWELNRHQWITWIAQAFVVTGEERYADFAIGALERWIRENPRGMGINWVSSLELSLRAIQWTAVLHLVRGSTAAITERIRPIVAHLEFQMRHVRTHLSTWFAPNTHLTGEALGLLVVGTSFAGFAAAAEWRACAADILRTQLFRQVSADGSYFEQSSWYQAYTVDFFVEALPWLELAGLPVPESVRQRVHAAARYLQMACRPDGSLVQIGDDDGGTLWRLESGERPHLQTLARAALRFDDPTLWPAGFPGEHATWLLATQIDGDESGVLTARSARHSAMDSFGALVGADGGLVRMVDRDDRDGSIDMALFDAGPHGMYGHPHADALSVDLSINGRPVVVDPGTGSYVGALRAQLRSTAAHATLEYDGRSTSVPNGAFGWTTTRGGTVLNSAAGASLSWAHGRLAGSLADGYLFEHERVILRLRGRAWMILDLVTAPAPGAPLCLRLPLAEGLEVGRTEHGTLECRRLGEAIASVCVDPSLGTQVATAAVSSAYGRVASGRVLEMRAVASRESAFCTAIGRTGTLGTLSRPDVTRNLWTYSDALGRVVLMAPRDGAEQWGGVRATGSWIVLEQSRQGLPSGAPALLRATGFGALRYAGVERVLQGTSEEIEIDLTPDLSIPSLS